MKLLESANKDVDKDKDGDVPKLEPAEVVLVHFNLVNNSYQYTFVPNKQFDQLITIRTIHQQC